MFEYAILRMIWWVLLGILLIGFAVTDGFDLGIGILLPFVARNNDEKRLAINTIGPVWEGNQVWIILGAGAIFAAWPPVYAVAFSGFYLAMFLALIGFILRPIGFKYRSKIDNTAWRTVWDIALFLGGLLPTFIFGVAVGNVLQGVPFYFDSTLRAFYVGTLWQLLNPFALFCGLMSICMLIMHGGLYLAIKTNGNVNRRSILFSRIGAALLIVLFILAGLWVKYSILGYQVSSPIVTDGPSNPLNKIVTTHIGAWFNNYYKYPWMQMVPVLGILAATFAAIFANVKNSRISFIASGISIFSIIATVGLSMFPFILPSSNHPQSSLLVWDASSSQLTLFIMLIATIIFLPIILMYTAWVYHVLRGKLTDEYFHRNKSSMY